MFDNLSVPEQSDAQNEKGGNDIVMKEAILGNTLVTFSNVVSPEKKGNKLSCGTVSGGSMNFDSVKVKSGSLIYSRKTSRESEYMEDLSKKVGISPRSSMANDISFLTLKEDANDIELAGIQNPTTNTCVHHMEGLHSELPRNGEVPKFSSISRKPGFDNSGMPTLKNPMANSVLTQLQIPSVNSEHQDESYRQPNDVKENTEIIIPACPPAKNNKKLLLGTINASSITSIAAEVKPSSLIYSRKFARKSVSKEELPRQIDVVSRSSLANDIPCLIPKQDTQDITSAAIQNPITNADFHHVEGMCDELPQKGTVPNFSSISPKSGFDKSDISVPHKSLANSVSAHLENSVSAYEGEPDRPLNDVRNESDSRANDTTPLKGPLTGVFRNAGSTVLLRDLRSTFNWLTDVGTPSGCSTTGCKLTNLRHDYKPVVVRGVNMGKNDAVNNLSAVSVDCKHEDDISPECQLPEASLPKIPELACQPGEGDIPVIEQSTIQAGETGQARQLKGVGSSSRSSKVSEIRKLSNLADPGCKTFSKGPIKKVVPKKRLSCRNELSAECSCKAGSSVYSNDIVSPNESTLRTEQQMETEHEQKDSDENRHMVGTITKDVTMELVKAGQSSALKSDRICVNKDMVAYTSKRKVTSECAFKTKEIEEPAFRETAFDKNNGTIKSLTNNVVMRGKVKKSRTKNAATTPPHVSDEPEKENKIPESVCANVDGLEGQNMRIECSGCSSLSSRKIGEITNRELQDRPCHNVILGSAWFIFSGQSLQRKELQKVVRRLKGKLCRDSHSWSYQATHFIVPNRVRRTEKFFAAAASGRWILKADYLVACNEAGKFLDEEPFEWYSNELTEDGAINLEAPRKWRLLRERTGHGAFHGMRIIIYGECIAPSLDTLKRVVKAGDGAILATSPPYTRVLKSGVDFAVISPGTPPADTWIQEFLKHNIACVLADYLVDYVCKPGYALDRHVLYETHARVEVFSAKLLGRSAEIVVAEHLGAL